MQEVEQELEDLSIHQQESNVDIDFENQLNQLVDEMTDENQPPEVKKEVVYNFELDDSIDKHPRLNMISNVMIDEEIIPVKAKEMKGSGVMNKSMATKNDGQIQFYKFLRYYEGTHPTKVITDGLISREKKFSIFDSLGTLAPKMCRKKTTPMARQIGIGSTLFLMSTKVFAILFFFLTITMIPGYVQLYSQQINFQQVVHNRFQDMFLLEKDQWFVYYGGFYHFQTSYTTKNEAEAQYNGIEGHSYKILYHQGAVTKKFGEQKLIDLATTQALSDYPYPYKGKEHVLSFPDSYSFGAIEENTKICNSTNYDDIIESFYLTNCNAYINRNADFCPQVLNKNIKKDPEKFKEHYKGNSTVTIQCPRNQVVNSLLYFGLNQNLDSKCQDGAYESYFQKQGNRTCIQNSNCKDEFIGPDPHKTYTLLDETFSFGKPNSDSLYKEANRNHKYSLTEKNNKKYYYGPHLYLQEQYQKLMKKQSRKYLKDVKRKEKEWKKLLKQTKKFTEYFDKTMKDAYYLRPMSWFELYFDLECKGKSACQVDIQKNDFKLLNSMVGISQSVIDIDLSNTFWQYSDASKLEIQLRWAAKKAIRWDYLESLSPAITIVAQCESKEVFDPSINKTVAREELLKKLAVGTGWSLLIIYIVLKFMIYSQTEYAKQFKGQTLEPDDFSVWFHLDTKDKEFQGDQNLLKASIIFYFQKIIQDFRPDLEPNNHTSEIIEVNFARKNLNDIPYLQHLNKLYYEYNENEKQCIATTDFGVKQNKQTKNQLLEFEFVDVKKQYVDDQAKKIVDYENAQNFKYAIVTFRSMKAVDLVKKAFDLDDVRVNKASIFNCFRPKQTKINNKIFFKQRPDILDTPDPDNIQWQNTKYSDRNLSLRSKIGTVLFLLFMFVQIVFVIQVKQLSGDNNLEVFNPIAKCPPYTVSKEEAQFQINKQFKDKNYMHCYCQNELDNNNFGLAGISFEEYKTTDWPKIIQDQDAIIERLQDAGDGFPNNDKTKSKEEYERYQSPDKNTYCGTWLGEYTINYSTQKVSTFLIVVLNQVLLFFYRFQVSFLKMMGIDDQTRSMYQRLYVNQYINIVFILLAISFKIPQPIFIGVTLFNGSISAINRLFYLEIGNRIVQTLEGQIIGSLGKKVFNQAQVIFKRFKDKDYKLNLVSQNPKEPGTFTINTKCETQEEFNTLYTGGQMQASFVYAANTSFFLVVVTFSSGVPILYPTAMLFYFCQYWFYKTMSLKYYVRDTTFAEDLPIYISQNIINLTMIMYISTSIIYLGALKPAQKYFPQSPTEAFSATGYYFSQALGEQHVQPYKVGLIVFLIISVICAVISRCQRMKRALQSSEIQRKGQDEAHSNDMYRELLIEPLKDVFMRAQTDRDNFKEFDLDAIKQYREDFEVKFSNEDYQKFLNQRCTNILAIVDDHIKFLGMEPTDYGTNDEKFQCLLENQVDLVGDKDDTNQENRLRIEALTQTYNMYDSKMFSGIKGIQKLLVESNFDFALGQNKKLSHNENAQFLKILEDKKFQEFMKDMKFKGEEEAAEMVLKDYIQKVNLNKQQPGMYQQQPGMMQQQPGMVNQISTQNVTNVVNNTVQVFV